MSDNKEFIANVEELAEANKQKLKEFFLTQILSQYKGVEPIIDWVLSSLFDKYPVLGTSHWNLWPYQKNEWLDRAIEFNYGIKRQVGGTNLIDSEYIELANISAIANLVKDNFTSCVNALKSYQTSLIGFYSSDNLFLHLAQDLSSRVLQGIFTYNKIYIFLENTYMLNLSKEKTTIINNNTITTKQYYFNRNGKYKYPSKCASRRVFYNGQQMAVARIQANNYIRLN